MKILLAFALCCILVSQILAQDPEGRRFCELLYNRCRREEPTVGTEDDTVGFFNEYCSRSNRNWRKVTRCQLVKASCIITMVRCENSTCKNVADSLWS